MLPEARHAARFKGFTIMQSARQLSGYPTLRLAVSGLLVAALAGCAALPSSGPTGSQIARASAEVDGQNPFHIVDIEGIADLPALAELPQLLRREGAPPPTDLIGAGDLLSISIYEAGVALFTGSSSSGSLRPGADPGTQNEKLPIIRVDDDGYIRVPYAGALRASGYTAGQLGLQIARALRGKSQDPQVLVSVQESISNSVLIGGEVAKPGRVVLSTNQETLSDAVALAGGYRGDSKDYAIRVQRGAIDANFRLSDVMSSGSRDMRVYPGDKISVVRAPQSFSVMGAPGKVDQIQFNAPTVSLAEAISLAGGSNPNLGDPQAIFVFRYVKNGEGLEAPTVYHLNMMKAQSYFLAQKFKMSDRDVLYIGNARANQPSKLVQIVSQLFAPIITARNIVTSN